jgi:hypothetical protein
MKRGNYAGAAKAAQASRSLFGGPANVPFWGAQAASLQVSAACRDHYRDISVDTVSIVAGKLRQLEARSLRSPEQILVVRSPAVSSGWQVLQLFLQ